MKNGQKVQQDDSFQSQLLEFIQECTPKLRTRYTCDSETDIKTSKVNEQTGFYRQYANV